MVLGVYYVYDFQDLYITYFSGGKFDIYFLFNISPYIRKYFKRICCIGVILNVNWSTIN